MSSGKSGSPEFRTHRDGGMTDIRDAQATGPMGAIFGGGAPFFSINRYEKSDCVSGFLCGLAAAAPRIAADTLWPIVYQERAERLGRPPLVPFARAAAALAGDFARPAC